MARQPRGSIGDRSPFARNGRRVLDVEAHGERDHARDRVSGADIMLTMYVWKFE